MKFLLNDLITNSYSFFNFIGDQVSVTVTPTQKKVMLIAVAIFSLFALFYVSYSDYFQAKDLQEDELIIAKQPKTIEKRLENNRMDARKQQMKEMAKNFKIEEGPVPFILETAMSDLTISVKPWLLVPVTLVPCKPVMAGVASCQGYRETMEDAEIINAGSFQVKDKEYPFTAFGICDGHGGNQASTFVKKNFQTDFEKALINNNQEELTDAGIFKALKECFQQLDADYLGIGGTTATVAVILNGKIWVANVGDSRTILVDKEGQATQASEDAKPSMERYKKTIEKLGGMVIMGRVNGLLGVARAIGDKDIVGARKEEEKKAQCCVSPNPKITCYSLADFEGGYLVLACDGLYDVATTDEVGLAIQQMDRKRLLVEQMSHRLVFNAIVHGSMDNVSVMVVKLEG